MVDSEHRGHRLFWHILSVPVSVKVFGIVLLVTVVFCTVTYLEVQWGTRGGTYYEHHIRAIHFSVHSLAAQLEPPMRDGDIPAIQKNLDDLFRILPDARYVVVLDAQGKLVAHQFAFSKETSAVATRIRPRICESCHTLPDTLTVARDLPKLARSSSLANGHFKFYARDGGAIIEAQAPIGESGAGSVLLGVSDEMITREAASINSALVRGFAVSCIVALFLSACLSYVLIHPLRDLLKATNRTRNGDFDARAEVFSMDEIGALASTFNDMAETVQEYREEVRQKSAAQKNLLDRIVQAQEDERKNISRELHDQLGQSLLKTLMSFQTMRKRCGCAGDDCTAVVEELRELIEEVRQLAWDLRPSILDDYGLESALDRYAQEISQRTGVHVAFQSTVPEGRRLPGRIEVTLYRVAQEAVTNVLRHAQASEVSITEVERDGAVVLVIEDNGRGFDTSSLSKTDGSSLGLMGMEERALLIGGQLDIESQIGTGTIVRIMVPLVEEGE